MPTFHNYSQPQTLVKCAAHRYNQKLVKNGLLQPHNNTKNTMSLNLIDFIVL